MLLSANRIIAAKKPLIALVSTLVLSACGGGDPTRETSTTAVHEGKPIYDKFCKVCHAQGLNGAPILGNSAMWGERINQGGAVLAEHAANGFGLMPANLGRDVALTEEAIASAVSYMLSQL